MRRTDDGKTPAMLLLEIDHGRDIRAIIEEALKEAGTVTGAAQKIGVDKGSMSRWMRHFGIRLATHVERRS